MEVYRLTKEKYAGILSGKGAAINGARWNSKGVEMIYTAANRSLAMAEVAVHFTWATLPDDYMMMTIEIPDDISITELLVDELPKDWMRFPHSVSTQAFGDDFVRDNKSCLLKVPSVVTKGDYNILINLHHPEFKKIRIKDVEEFPFDRRLFK